MCHPPNMILSISVATDVDNTCTIGCKGPEAVIYQKDLQNTPSTIASILIFRYVKFIIPYSFLSM